MFAASKSGRTTGGGPAPTTDPSFGYVPLLLNTTSTNGQQNNTFLDSSTNNFTITRNGTPTQGSITPYWPNGQWSNYFTTSNYINSTTNSNVFQFGSNAYTVEGWIYQTSRSATQYICGGVFSGAGFQISIDTSGFIDGIIANVGNLSPATTAFPLNTWTHFAIVRTSTSTNGAAYYINGAAAGTITDSNNISGTASAVNVGTSASAGSVAFNGYISNFRVTNGRAVYSGAFTPSTVPLTATTGGTNPPTGTQCTLLTCQSNRFKDNSAQVTPSVFTPSGSPTVQAFQPFSPTASYTTALYGGSGYFGGSPSYLSFPANSAMNFGTGDFTVEAWVYPTATPGDGAGPIGGATSNILFAYSASAFPGKWAFGRNNVAFDFSSLTDIVLNTWTHLAVSRSSGTIRFFINGALTNSASNSNSYILTGGGNIGFNGASSYFTGYMSQIRAVGTAVYTGAFTPPTLAPITTAGSTSAASYSSTTNVNTSFAASSTGLLLDMTNAGIYDAAAQNDLTTVGEAQTSISQYKWSPTSMKFDPATNSDYLTSIDNPQLQLGTGDFTIEGWVYLSAISVAYGIISKGTATTGWSVNVTALNKLQFSYTASVLTGTTSLATGTWYYFAVVRSGSATGNLKIYLNGTADATSGGAVTDNFNQTSILYVGADRIGTSALNGYLQDVRITKYARTITTPTAAFPTR